MFKNIIRVFPRKTNMTPDDALAFVGDPPMEQFRPPQHPVKVSVSFSWDKDEGLRLADAWAQFYPDVEIGGPAFNSPCDSFTPGMFVKKGVTFTSRGCRWKCGYCDAWKREPLFLQLPICDGHTIQDNNFLANPRPHIEETGVMLRRQKEPANFKGGLDPRFLKGWHREFFDSIRVKELWFACDQMKDIKQLKIAQKMFEGYSQNKLRCYTMIGFEETIEEATKRLEIVYNMGFLPYAQLYKSDKEINYSQDWHDLGRIFSRPAATRGYMKTANEADRKRIEEAQRQQRFEF